MVGGRKVEVLGIVKGSVEGGEDVRGGREGVEEERWRKGRGEGGKEVEERRRERGKGGVGGCCWFWVC